MGIRAVEYLQHVLRTNDGTPWKESQDELCFSARLDITDTSKRVRKLVVLSQQTPSLETKTAEGLVVVFTDHMTTEIIFLLALS